MKNSLNRFIPDNMKAYDGLNQIFKQKNRKLVPEILTKNENKQVNSLRILFDLIPITDGMTLSFHHHLRNGDGIINMVLNEIKTRNLKNMTLAPSAIFPIHEPMCELIKNKSITQIFTNYINGPVSQTIGDGYLEKLVIMDTHGGRARAIESGELFIDVAFIGVPCADIYGNGNGLEGPSACGTLGYAIADMKYAKHKVVITDYLTSNIAPIEIESKYIDYVIKVNAIGKSEGIVSGTTRPTKDPVQLKIARDTIKLIKELGYIKKDMSFQTGAGGTSLAVAQMLINRMIENKIKGSFASGGITGYLVEMHEYGLFKRLYDVQCFDHEAIASLKRNANHYAMSASKYANPFEENPIVNDLDVVILGATEIDSDFNVNVTTDSNGLIIGGSGGHSDTAFGAKLTIITTNLVKSRTSIVKDYVTTITTPGETVDCLVTERGIAINPKRTDLIKKLSNSKLNILTIDQLLLKAHDLIGIPKEIEFNQKVIGVVRYRDGSIIDSIYKLRGDQK